MTLRSSNNERTCQSLVATGCRLLAAGLLVAGPIGMCGCFSNGKLTPWGDRPPVSVDKSFPEAADVGLAMDDGDDER